MAEEKTWAEMTYIEQTTELKRLERQVEHELLKAKLSVLEASQNASNAYSTVAMTQAYAHLEGTLTSSTSLQHNR